MTTLSNSAQKIFFRVKYYLKQYSVLKKAVYYFRKFRNTERDSFCAGKDLQKDLRDFHRDVTFDIGLIHKRLSDLEARFVTKRMTVVFLLHNVATIDSLVLLIEKMLRDKTFTVHVITINHKFPNDLTYSGEAELHNYLDGKGISHMRLRVEDADYGLNHIRSLRPIVLFRQSPWDCDIQTQFSANNFSFTNLAYVNYFGIGIVCVDEKMSDAGARTRDYLRSCWRLYAGNSDDAGWYASLGLHFTDVKMSPKLEYLHHEVRKPKTNLFNTDKKILIWAPHHSIYKDYQSMSTFPFIYQTILDFAKKGEYFFVLRPHPAFYGTMLSSTYFDKESLDHFFDAWNSLDNTAISDGEDYAHLFRESDAMITDGISFLSSYQICDKPIFWTVNPNHNPLTHLGAITVESVYAIAMADISEIESRVHDVVSRGNDPLAEARRRYAKQYLFDADSGVSPSSLILEDIKNTLLPCGAQGEELSRTSPSRGNGAAL